MLKARRKKKCKVCRDWFRPGTSTQVVCSMPCAIMHSKQKTFSRLRRERRAAKERIKPRNKVQAEAQAAFNAFIRLRDEGLPCISCGAKNPPARFGGSWDCGHYLTVGAHPELRFEELNAHRQCKWCNAGAGRFSGKSRTVQQDYRKRLILRIDLAKVEWVEGNHQPKKYTIDDLREIKATYQRKARELRRARP